VGGLTFPCFLEWNGINDTRYTGAIPNLRVSVLPLGTGLLKQMHQLADGAEDIAQVRNRARVREPVAQDNVQLERLENLRHMPPVMSLLRTFTRTAPRLLQPGRKESSFS
jgi:hypothetical protein